MNFQIRIRTDEDFPNVSYIQDWLDAAQQGFAFEHNKPGNHHYHVYLFGLERNVDAMRRTIGRYLPKECYSVGTTCGGKKRLKITEIGAYQYGTTNILLDPIWTKGFPLDVIQEYRKNAELHYKPMPVTVITREDHYVVRPDRVWERLHANAEQYGGITIKAIKSKLCAEWLNNGKAIPRPSDLHRYAVSLYYLNKYKKSQIGDTEIPDTALMEEFE